MRRILPLIAALLGLACVPAAGADAPTPLITRIRIATLGAPDIGRTVGWYQKWLGYRVVDSGKVPADLAASWGASKTAGRRYALLAPAGTPDVFIRVVAIDGVPGFRADTTFGWNSVELIVDDLHALATRLKKAGVTIERDEGALDPPFASIHAMQVHGTAEEIVNLSSETGDRSKSNLPVPKSQVDRIFLVSAAGPDLEALRSYWAEVFKMKTFTRYDLPIPIVARALDVPADTIFPSTLVRAAERGNTVELHQFPQPAQTRPHQTDQLPPGVAMVSFGLRTLEVAGVTFIAPPTARTGAAYGGKRVATTRGAAGELIELIEEGDMP